MDASLRARAEEFANEIAGQAKTIEDLNGREKGVRAEWHLNLANCLTHLELCKRGGVSGGVCTASGGV
jgi:hypothetical protein